MQDIKSETTAVAPITEKAREIGSQAVEKVRIDATQAATEAKRLADFAWNLVTEWGLKVIGVVLLLIVSWMLASWARRALFRALNKPHFDQTLIRFLSNILRWAILAIGFVAALTVFGIAPASLAAVVGATGLAIGLALQGSLSNLAAGIMLLILRPFKVGDVVTVVGQTGVVDEIELFYTKMDTADRRRVLLPNGSVFGAVIDNQTHHRTRCVIVTVGIDYAADIDQTREVLLRAARSVAHALADPPPAASLQNLAPSNVEWQIHVWAPTQECAGVRQDLIKSVKTALESAGISIPCPQLAIWNRAESPRNPA